MSDHDPHDPFGRAAEAARLEAAATLIIAAAFVYVVLSHGAMFVALYCVG